MISKVDNIIKLTLIYFLYKSRLQSFSGHHGVHTDWSLILSLTCECLGKYSLAFFHSPIHFSPLAPSPLKLHNFYQSVFHSIIPLPKEFVVAVLQGQLQYALAM